MKEQAVLLLAACCLFLDELPHKLVRRANLFGFSIRMRASRTIGSSMFGWFTPKCPLDTSWKAWTERRMVWLADRLGIERLLKARVVEPTDEFFPDLYAADSASARKCLDQMCGYMGVDPEKINLKVVADEEMPGAAGLYEQRARSNIYVAESQLSTPAALLKTLAHELAHEILLGGELVTGDTPDHEQVTDLLPVFLGVGIFAANETVSETRWNYGATYSGYTIQRLGYLTSFELGYALALFAYMRGELRPKWAKHLRPDAGKTLARGLRFIDKTGDSLFHPDTIQARLGKRSVVNIIEQLEDSRPTFRLDALNDIVDRTLADPQLIPAIRPCLDDRDEHVKAAAAHAVGIFGSLAAGLIPRLIAMLREDQYSACTAVRTLVNLGAEPSLVIPEFIDLLKVDPDTAGTVALAVGAYGDKARAMLPSMLTAFRRSLVREDADIAAIRTALRAISSDLRRDVREHFADDPELLHLALFDLKSDEA